MHAITLEGCPGMLRGHGTGPSITVGITVVADVNSGSRIHWHRDVHIAAPTTRSQVRRAGCSLGGATLGITGGSTMTSAVTSTGSGSGGSCTGSGTGSAVGISGAATTTPADDACRVVPLAGMPCPAVRTLGRECQGRGGGVTACGRVNTLATPSTGVRGVKLVIEVHKVTPRQVPAQLAQTLAVGVTGGGVVMTRQHGEWRRRGG